MSANNGANKHSYMLNFLLLLHNIYGGARGVMVIVVGNGHGDSCSNPGRE